MSAPRNFYETTVKPSYQDWGADPLAEHRAKATFGFANDMACSREGKAANGARTTSSGMSTPVIAKRHMLDTSPILRRKDDR